MQTPEQVAASIAQRLTDRQCARVAALLAPYASARPQGDQERAAGISIHDVTRHVCADSTPGDVGREVA